MSLTISLLRRPTPLAAHATVASTRRFLSQRPRHRPPPPPPPPQNPPKIPAEPPAPPPPPPPLDSPAAYTSIVSHAASPSHLTTAVDRAAQAHLAGAAAFFEKDARFLYSAARPRDHPHNPHVPEVVLLGASNVGKSTLLNALIGRRGIARTSAKPGHTTLMNAYGLGPPPPRPEGSSRDSSTPPPRHGLVVVDTPGYGYRSQATWGDTVVRYLGARTALRGAVVLLAAEKRLTAEDKWLLSALADADVRTLAVLTKADKVAGGNWAARCADKAEEVRQELRRVERGSRSMNWRESEGWSSDVLVTAAGLARMGKASNAAGLGAVRAAILDMAGVVLESSAEEQKPEDISYTGKIVSFDDIVWKS